MLEYYKFYCDKEEKMTTDTMAVCAGKMESFDYAFPIGIGMVVSAINLTQLCTYFKPKRIIFIGSSGSYGHYKLFDIIESKGASHVALSFLQQQSYTPIDNIVISKCAQLRHDTMVNSANYITTDFSLAKEFDSHKIGVENMEFFSVLRVAKEFNIEAAGIFCISNYCDVNAHEDFKSNHKKTMETLNEYTRERLKVFQLQEHVS